MTTAIDTIDDFSRILRENPDWVDTVRGLLLSKELLELPERLARFAAATDTRLARIEADIGDLKEEQAQTRADIGELKERQAETAARLARIEADIGDLKEEQAQTRADIGELKERQAEAAARLARIEDDIGDLKEEQAQTRADIGELKEGQAETAARLARIEADIGDLKEGQAQTRADIGELKERQAETEARLARIEAHIVVLQEGQAKADTDIGELKEGQVKADADIAALKEGQARLQEDVETLKAGQEAIMRNQRRIMDDIGFIRGRFTAIATQEEIRGIVNELGFVHRHTLTKDEIMDVSLSQDSRDIPRRDLRGFRRADFIVEVADAAGAINYVTVEASYTLTEYDRQRAVRNAGLMTRLTGRPSYPALTGVRIDHELADPIANGEILWYKIDEADLTPE